MKERIDKHIANSSVIEIELEIEGEDDSFYGIPILRSRTLVTFYEIDLFHLDGFRIIRLKDIVGIRRNEFEVTKQRILKEIGALKNLAKPSGLRITSWKSLLAFVKKESVCAKVESGLIEVDVFAIGEVHSLSDDCVVLKSFDAHGKWCKPKHKIKYSDITEVGFGDEYTVSFSEFVNSSQK